MPTKNLALTREQLDKMTCSVPGCAHETHPLVLHGRCHPKSPQSVRMSIDERALEVSCKSCGAFISLLAVALEEVEAIARILGEAEIESARAQGLLPGMRFHQNCHRGTGLYAVYSNGHLIVMCAECQTPAHTFHILERHTEATA